MGKVVPPRCGAGFRVLLLLGLILSLAGQALPARAAGADLLITPDGQARMEGKTYRCALGRSGVRQDKREGDGATPAGSFFLREARFRADKINQPVVTRLPVQSIAPDDGWCDDPGSHQYNRPVTLPLAASHERLWRDDDLYDLIVVVGYNDEPVVKGRGSAIFLHVAAPGFRPTAGCIAFQKSDLLEILRHLDTRSRVVIQNSR